MQSRITGPPVTNRDNSPHAARPTVVLVHGWGAGPLWMSLLEKRLQQRGFAVENWGYRSLWSSIEPHGVRLRERLEDLAEQRPFERIHLVTHSMGGIVARHALALGRPRGWGRMVMLAPPNRGSFVASLFAPVLGQLSPPLRQLTTDETSFVNRLAEPRGIEFGVIAAARDHLVALSSTCLPSQADHIVAPGRHAAVLFQRDVVEQIVTFLGTGRFLETARRVCDVRSTLLAS